MDGLQRRWRETPPPLYFGELFKPQPRHDACDQAWASEGQQKHAMPLADTEEES